jgi:hypothetical protein
MIIDVPFGLQTRHQIKQSPRPAYHDYGSSHITPVEHKNGLGSLGYGGIRIRKSSRTKAREDGGRNGGKHRP